MPYQADLRDLRFVLFDLLKLDDLLGEGSFAELDRATLDQILDEAERFAREQLAPLDPVGDRVGCHFAEGSVTLPPGFGDAYRAFCELGFGSAQAPPEEGGLGVPQAFGLAMDEVFVSANCAFSNYPSLSRACANMLRVWGSPAQKERYLPPLVAGRFQGTMCLTEPQAGSFLGAVRCLAEPQAGGGWRLSGQKSFITSTNLDIVDDVIHFVLARTPGAPAGVKGISLFLVPHRRLDPDGEPGAANDVRILGIEEKMGIHGSVTTTLSFGDEGACEAELVGELHQGLRAMFHIMNEERVQVGLQGQSLGALAYAKALDYARERVQGVPIQSKSREPADQVPIIQHPDVRRMLLTMKAYVEGSRALILRAGVHQDRARAAADPAIRARHSGWAELLTPICKGYCSDLGFEVTVLAMQVFGGAGYVRETGVEQHLRDSRIASVYEGTNGIQAQDLLFRKLSMQQGALLKTWLAELAAFCSAQAEHPSLAEEVGALQAGAARLAEVARDLGARLAQGQVEQVALSASPLLRFCGNLMLAWLLLEEAVLAERMLATLSLPAEPEARRAELEGNPQARHLASKAPTARFFLRHLLPANEGLARSILERDASALDVVF